MQEFDIERYYRMLKLLEADPVMAKLMEETTQNYNDFLRLTRKFPKALRKRLWKYPGTLYFLHHRTLLILCRTMRFDDEYPTQ